MAKDILQRMADDNDNRRYDVRGTVELGDDGYVEICLMDAAGGSQVIHLHRYPDGKKRCIGWDCWVFEDTRGRRDHHLMGERKKR
jgi:hypothetical protein